MEKYIERLFIVYSFKFKSTEILLAFFFRCLLKHAYHAWFTLDLNARFFPIVKALREKKIRPYNRSQVICYLSDKLYNLALSFQVRHQWRRKCHWDTCGNFHGQKLQCQSRNHLR